MSLTIFGIDIFIACKVVKDIKYYPIKINAGTHGHKGNFTCIEVSVWLYTQIIVETEYGRQCRWQQRHRRRCRCRRNNKKKYQKLHTNTWVRERLCSLCPDKIARGHNDNEMIFHLVSSSEPFFFLFHFINRD